MATARHNGRFRPTFWRGGWLFRGWAAGAGYWEGLIAAVCLVLCLVPTVRSGGAGGESSGFQPPGATAEGWAVPQPGYAFTFPRDHGSHPTFKIEWWYITGHFRTAAGRSYGFQATFFRSAAPRSESTTPPTSPAATEPAAFTTQQLHMAHMAVVDLHDGSFHYQERLNREGWDAAAAIDHLDVFNGNWSLRGVAPPLPSAESPASAAPPDETMHLLGGVQADMQFDFTLKPTKPRVIFGENGVSRKGADPTAASYYITFPRLALSGTLTVDNQPVEVIGQAWMDHEISSSQLDAAQVGWDWASVQLDDGREIMVYVLRHADGSADPFSSLTWIDAESRLTRYTPADFSLRPVRQWTSPHTGGVYPVSTAIVCIDPATGERRVLTLQPVVDDQEIVGRLGRVNYWEGACRVFDEHGKPVGRAYLELTGYAQGLNGRF